MRDAIYNEVFLDLYEKWGPGRYYSASTKKVVEIKSMNTTYLTNVIQVLTEMRNRKLGAVMSLEDDNDIVSEIKVDYANGNDVLAIKISELRKELKQRNKTKLNKIV